MAKLRLKKGFRHGVTERHVDGFGMVKFDPSRVGEKEYEKYQKKGFDIFEEVTDEEAKTQDQAEAKKATGVNYEDMKLPQLKEIAKDRGIDVTGLKKAEIIEEIQKEGAKVVVVDLSDSEEEDVIEIDGE